MKHPSAFYYYLLLGRVSDCLSRDTIEVVVHYLFINDND